MDERWDLAVQGLVFPPRWCSGSIILAQSGQFCTLQRGTSCHLRTPALVSCIRHVTYRSLRFTSFRVTNDSILRRNMQEYALLMSHCDGPSMPAVPLWPGRVVFSSYWILLLDASSPSANHYFPSHFKSSHIVPINQPPPPRLRELATLQLRSRSPSSKSHWKPSVSSPQ